MHPVSDLFVHCLNDLFEVGEVACGSAQCREAHGARLDGAPPFEYFECARRIQPPGEVGAPLGDISPVTGAPLVIESPLPGDLAGAAAALAAGAAD